MEFFDNDLILHEVISFGGMGEIYRATQIGVGGFEKAVAVKRILPGLTARAEFAEMFLRETTISGKLQHPNIVQVFRNGRAGDHLYLVMEYLRGQSLESLIERAQAKNLLLPIGLVCYVIAEAARGLDYAHNYVDEIGRKINILHRDISPSNLMVTYLGEVKLLDFGLAKGDTTQNLTQTGALKGKMAYLSPEVVHGQTATRRSDLFSLGICLYEALTNVRLFDGGATIDTIRKVASCEVPPIHKNRPEIDSELDRILMKLLAREPEARYAEASELYRDLTAYTAKHFPGTGSHDASVFLRTHFEREIREDEQRRQDSRRTLDAVREAGASGSAPRVSGAKNPAAVEPGSGVFPLWQILVLLILVVVNVLLGKHYFAQRNAAKIPVFPAETASSFVPPLSSRIQGDSTVPPVFNSSFAAVVPDTLPGLLAWFKADSINLADGAPVSDWFDSGPAGTRAFQFDAGSRPVFLTKAFNGKPGMAFDGFHHYFVSESLGNSIAKVRSLTVFSISRVQDNRVQYVWSIHGSSNMSDVARGGFSHGGRTLRVLTGSNREGLRPISEAMFPVENRTLLLITVLGENYVQLYANGRKVIDKSLPTVTPFANARRFTIGQEWDPAGPSDLLNGEIGEIIVFDHVLSGERIHGVERYLAEKYSLSLDEVTGGAQ